MVSPLSQLYTNVGSDPDIVLMCKSSRSTYVFINEILINLTQIRRHQIYMDLKYLDLETMPGVLTGKTAASCFVIFCILMIGIKSGAAGSRAEQSDQM